VARVCEGKGNDEAVGHFDSILKVSGEGPSYDVEPIWERETPTAPASGPAMVNSPAFRSGWDSIFGKTTVGSA